MRLLIIIATLFFAAGCATSPESKTSSTYSNIIVAGGTRHVVKSGETLWGISKVYGVNLKDLVRANNINDSSSIEKGQIILIPSNHRSSTIIPMKLSVSNESFIWPVKGRMITNYRAKVDNVINKGIDISVPEGTNVKAARSGRIVYCDSHMKGFGKTIIIDHGDNLQSVYSFNSEILVKVGDNASKHDIIAKTGRTGRAKEPSLHFEVRKDGEPQNPLYYLPR